MSLKRRIEQLERRLAQSQHRDYELIKCVSKEKFEQIDPAPRTFYIIGVDMSGYPPPLEKALPAPGVVDMGQDTRGMTAREEPAGSPHGGN